VAEHDGLAQVEIVSDDELPLGGGQAAAPSGVESPRQGDVSDDERTVISRRTPPAGNSSSKIESPAAAPSPRADLGNVLAGIVLGHFRLEKFVGGGGMGSVFRGTDLRLGRTVAIKVLSRDRTDPETLRRFQNEAQSAARLDHENIARVYYVGEDQGLHFIVFEYIEGVNIRDLVEKNGPLPLGEAISYLLQVAEALEHASQRHVVHRDIKPSNILVTADGRAKLVDMGLARLRMESDREDLTASGVTLGTFDYISPEQARDPRIADVRSDLYSLGCTFYFMLTGRPPFPEGTLLQKLLSHSSEPPADPRSVRPDLDEQVAGIVGKLLAKQPRDRYQQPNELIGELLLVADRLHLPGLKVTGAVWLGSRRSHWARIERMLPWLVPIALLFASVFALERLWFDSGGPRAAEPLPKAKAPKDAPLKKVRAAGPTKPAKQPGAVAGSNKTTDRPAARTATPAVGPSKPVGAAPAALQPGPAPATAVPETPVGPRTKPAEVSPADQGQPGEPASALLGTPPEAAQPASGTYAPAAAGDATATVPKAGTVSTPAAASKPALEVASVAGAETKAPAVTPVVTRIVVTAADGTLPGDAKAAATLADACRDAAALDVETIELHFDGVREEKAFDISSPKLTIRNGLGFQPSLRFRPAVDDLAGDRRMVRLHGGMVAWSGIHLELELPAGTPDRWALFSLRACDSFELQDAVLTVRAAGAQFPLPPDRVTMLEVGDSQRRESPVQEDAEAASKRAIPPYIGLENCVARGQATLIRGEQAKPLRISGRQCLFVLSEGLLDVGGRDTKPVQADARIELSLKNVTAVLGRDLCRLSSDALTPFQLDLVTDCKNSILYLTDTQAALLERRGVRDLGELEKHLYVRGRDNFYPGSDQLLRLNPTGDPKNFVTYGFAGRSESWYQEESPRFTLMWKSLPAADRPLDQHGPADYLLDESEQNPALYDGGETQAGADAALLPSPD
jgi:serine/threonine-protein kinase